MPVLRRNAGGSNPAELLKAALFEQQQNAEPGVVPSGMAHNAYLSAMPASAEQEREGAVLAGEDQRYQDRMNATQDLQQQETAANTGARVMGFESPRAQAEHAAQEKLRQVLIPEQMKLDAASAGADEARTYSALEHEKDRQSRADLLHDAQAAQTGRTEMQVGATNNRFQQLHPPSPWDKLKGLLGMGSPAQTPPPAAGSMEEPTVKIQDPQSGEVRDVPQSRAAGVIARGGIRVQ